MNSKNKDYIIRLNKIDEERKTTAPTMCKMHFMKQPMKVSKANKQYLFDELGKFSVCLLFFLLSHYLLIDQSQTNIMSFFLFWMRPKYYSRSVLTDLGSANYLCNLIKLFLCSLENVSRLIFILPKISRPRLPYQIKKK